MELSVIITTYNRPEKCSQLVHLLKKQRADLNIIIVDSGERDPFTMDHLNEGDRHAIILIKSKHKNQPFQRYLGYTKATSKWLLYLDDDMEPLEGALSKLEHLVAYLEHDYGYFAIHFEDKHTDTFLKKQRKSVFSQLNNFSIVRLFRSLSGYPILPSGQFGRNGVKGAQAPVSGETYHSSGGAFLAKRALLYKNFNMQLFDLYEQRMGKGEDGMLSYTASKSTKLYYIADLLFWHNDQRNSVYTKNHFQFNKVVAYSRLYLGLEYARLNNYSLIYARCSYLNYSFWRIVGKLINLFVKPSKKQLDTLRGYIIGTWSALFLKYNKKLQRNTYWTKEANG